MAKRYRIEYDKEKCIGCGACAAVCPKFWEMGPEGKAALKENQVASLVIFEKDLECSMEAKNACPADAIKVVDLERKEPAKQESPIEKEMKKEWEMEAKRKAELDKSLTKQERELKEKVMIVWDSYPGMISCFPTVDPEKCQCNHCKNRMKRSNEFMEDITSKLSLAKIKKMLTPQEYYRFLPAYVEYKRDGKVRVEGHGEGV